MEANTVSFPLFDAHGIRLTFVLPYAGDPQTVHAAVGQLLASGFAVNAPGLEDGEKYEDIAFIVRRAQIRDDGTEVPIIDLYPEKLNFRFVSTYLDTQEHVAAFEAAVGLQLANVATYEGSAPIERGKNGKLDQKYVVRLPRLTKIVYKDNPRFEEGGTKPKRYFERWHAAPASNVVALPPQASAANPPPPPASTGSTSTTSGSAGGSGELKVIDGSDPNALDEVFGKRLEKATPDTVYASTANLFNARAHFNNWWAKHAERLIKLALPDAITFAQNERWHRDKERVKLVFQFGERLSLQTNEVLDALNFANGKPMEKVSANWDGGNMGIAHAAVLAYACGYNIEHLNNWKQEGAVPEGMYDDAAKFCASYNAGKEKAS